MGPGSLLRPAVSFLLECGRPSSPRQEALLKGRRCLAPVLTSACLPSRVPAAVPEQGLLQPAPALCVPLWLPWSPLRGSHP